MKTLLLFACFLFAGLATFAQADTTATIKKRTLSEDKKTYIASNGKVYKVGDNITFLTGSGKNNEFKQTSWLVMMMPMADKFLDSDAAGSEIPIIELRQEKYGAKRVFAVIKTGGAKFGVFIEGSIASKEIQ